jgi:AraC-like DNA-binding protein
MIRNKAEELRSNQWIYQNTLPFNLTIEGSFSWGNVQLLLQIENAAISHITLYTDALAHNLPATLKETLLDCPFTTESIKKALVYITENYETATLEAVARYCGLSYNHFSASFKRIIGRSFTDYLDLIRINEAERLLLSTDNSVTDIAFSCGFSSSSHFISRFKSQKGITPGQFRKKIR